MCWVGGKPVGTKSLWNQLVHPEEPSITVDETITDDYHLDGPVYNNMGELSVPQAALSEGLLSFAAPDLIGAEKITLYTIDVIPEKSHLVLDFAVKGSQEFMEKLHSTCPPSGIDIYPQSREALACFEGR